MTRPLQRPRRDRRSRKVVERAAGSRLRKLVAAVAVALPLGVRLPRIPERRPWAGDVAADRRLRGARKASPDVLPQVRNAACRARRLGVELALAREAPRPADADPRLDLLAVRRAAFRHARLRALRRR